MIRNEVSILVIEDEEALCEAIISYLCLEGFSALGVNDTEKASEILSEQSFDILIVDIGLPVKDGLTWLNESQFFAHTGIIISSARGEKTDRLKGLKVGADAYLTKPVDYDELILVIENIYGRISAIRQKSLLNDQTLTQPLKTRVDIWKLNTSNWLLITPKPTEISIELTKSEFKLLVCLFEHCTTSVSKAKIITDLGENIECYDFRRLEVLIRRLKNKVKAKTDLELPIKTIHSKGYAFTANVELIE